MHRLSVGLRLVVGTRSAVSVAARVAIVSFLMFAVAGPAGALDQIFSQTDVDITTETQLVLNPSFEEGEPGPHEDETGQVIRLEEWRFWQDGYVVEPGAGRNGSRAIRCTSEGPDQQYGAGQRIDLNQERPLPLIASAWSRAQDVSGSPNSDYSIYLDFIFQDGTTWWGQTANFSTGTHDWEERRFVVVPQKPIRTVALYVIFRRHSGTVYFDDVTLVELRGDTYMFEGVPVRPQPVRAPVEKVWIPYMETRNGLQMALERDRARVCGVWVNQEKIGLNGPGVFARDVAARSDFLAPWRWNFRQQEGALTINGTIEPLDLDVQTTFRTQPDHIDIRGVVKDRRGADRAITLYFGIPVDETGWIWCHDLRDDVPATATVYMNASMTGAGATGQRSGMPVAAIFREGQNRGIAMGVPLDDPRHSRMGFDARTGLFYAAFDFGLSPKATKTPGEATFRLVMFPFAASWRYRGALAQYYRLFPEYFERRSPLEGLLLPETDFGTIAGAEDLGFAFHYVRGNVGLHPSPGVLSFVHSEPANVWLPLPESVPRNYEGALNHLGTLRADTSRDPQHLAGIIDSSGLLHPTGDQVLNMALQPWCDGASVAVNPDPELAGTWTQGKVEMERILSRMQGEGVPMLAAWTPVAGGYAVDNRSSAQGGQSLRLDLTSAGMAGAAQRAPVDQEEARPLTLRATVRTRGLRSRSSNACVVAVDLHYDDGTALPEQTLAITEELRNFQTIETTIEPAKPVAAATVRLLLREARGASVWFDDVFLGEAGGETNLLRDPGMEGEVIQSGTMAGAFLDNYGAWTSTINYNPAHFAAADYPLVFDTHTMRLGILNVFSTYEFHRELATRLRAQGRLIMVNGPGTAINLTDIVVSKINWCVGGNWRPAHDRNMISQRAQSYQKPVCLLMNTDFDQFTREPRNPYARQRAGEEEPERPRSMTMTERYFQRAMFYGMYPGFFSADDATNPYFENPELYEEARPLFQKYLPLIRTLATAGWEPLTGVRASHDQILIERFGAQEQGQVYITMAYADMRWIDELDTETELQPDPPINAVIAMNMAYVGFLGRDVEVYDMLNETVLESTRDQSYVSFSIEVKPFSATMVRVRPIG